MCQYISGVAVKDGETVRVYTLPDKDSHSDIRETYKIRDDAGPGAQLQTPVELVPVRGLDRVEDFDFVFDAERPAWWTDEMTEEATRQLFTVHQARYRDGKIVMAGNLDLSSLTSLPEGVSLTAEGNLDLGRLVGEIPAGVIKQGRVIR